MMLSIITDRPLDRVIADRLPPLQDFREYYSLVLDVPFPPEMGLEEWFDSLPPMHGVGRWHVPPWRVPQECKEILHLGAVDLVDMTYDRKRYSLNSLLGTNERWHFYVDPHDTGYGKRHLRTHVAMLFVYWYLTVQGGRICLYEGQNKWDDDTPVANIDLSSRLPGERPVRMRMMPDVLYSFHSSNGVLRGHDVGRLLLRMGDDTDGTNDWFHPKDGLTLEGLMDIACESVYATMVFDAEDRYDPDSIPPRCIDPIEVVLMNGNEPFASDSMCPDVRLDVSRYRECRVSRYAITSEHRGSDYLSGINFIDYTDHEYRVFLLAFIDMGQSD